MNTAVQVATSGHHSLVLKEDGTVWAWGYNWWGQIGNGTFSWTGCECAPFPFRALVTDVAQIDAGFGASLALKKDGTVWIWGSGLGSSSGSSTVPYQTGVNLDGFNNIISISMGNSHAVALSADGRVWSWCWNSRGQLGNGSSQNWTDFPARIEGISGVTQIAAGDEHTAALKKDGTVWIWGRNDRGQIGNDTITSDGCLCIPVPTQANITDVTDIKAEGNFTIARKRDGTVWIWGDNQYGQAGNGTTTNNQRVPTQSTVGTGNALIGAGLYSAFSAIPSFATPKLPFVRHYGENINLLFFDVKTEGTTSYSAIDPTTTGLSVPAGYTIQPNAQAYNISSAATFTKSVVCVKAASEYDPEQFALLKLLHAENGTLVDRTTYSSLRRRQVCGRVNTPFSQFVIAKGLTPTPSGLSISGRILNSNNRGIAGALVTITGQDGNKRFAHANPFGYYRFNNVSANETHTIAVISKQIRFEPQSITVFDNIEDINFTVQP